MWKTRFEMKMVFWGHRSLRQWLTWRNSIILQRRHQTASQGEATSGTDVILTRHTRQEMDEVDSGWWKSQITENYSYYESWQLQSHYVLPWGMLKQNNGIVWLQTYSVQMCHHSYTAGHEILGLCPRSSVVLMIVYRSGLNFYRTPCALTLVGS